MCHSEGEGVCERERGSYSEGEGVCERERGSYEHWSPSFTIYTPSDLPLNLKQTIKHNRYKNIAVKPVLQTFLVFIYGFCDIRYLTSEKKIQ